MEPVDYNKRKGGMRNEGVQYQHNLTLTTWLRADKTYSKKYQILPEWDRAGDLDDVVLKYEDKKGVHYRFLQAKHFSNESQIITYKWFFEKNEIKIEKYFESYEEFHKNIDDGEIVDLILFTNLALYNGSKDVDVAKYVTSLPADDPIFHFKQKKANGSEPMMYNLNKNFIKAYMDNEKSKLNCMVETFIKCFVEGQNWKKSGDLFKEYQVIISTEIANVKESKFHSNFIDCKELSEGTKQFRRILLEELAKNDSSCSSQEAQQHSMRNVSLKFPPDFGKSMRNKKTNNWPICTPEREDLFEKFCGLFKLATNQPNEKELVEFIKLECEEKLWDKDSATLRLKDDISDWYNKDKSPYPLNSMSLIGLAFMEKNKKIIDELSPLKLQFKHISYEEDLKSFFQPSGNETNLFHLSTKGYINVSLLKLFKSLEKLQQINYLFCPRAEISTIEKFSEIFRESEIFKILVWEIQSDEIDLEFMKEVINENKEKKVILVTNFNKGEEKINNFHPFRKIEDLTRFEDLEEETQKLLLQRKILFQGKEVSFNTIYCKEILPNHQDNETWGILLDKQIAINTTFVELDLKYYINRTLTADIPYFNKETLHQKLGDQHIVTYNNDDFNEQIKQHPTRYVHFLYELNGFWCVARSNWEIKELSKYKEGTHHFEFNDTDGKILHQIENIFVISDMAGYGKTTSTWYLANELQKQYPNCWVTRLQPSQLRFDPDEIKLTHEADICKYDKFIMENLFKLSSPLERFIFKQYLEDEESKSQLYFIFDGFDEIDGDYQKVIIQAVKYLKTKRNVKFIGIFTRPQHQGQLEEKLQSITFKLLKFDHQNKITFLEKFWLSRGVKGPNERLVDYSERLIRRISQSISDKESELTGVPLQMRMIGEIYEDDAIKFVAERLKENEIVAVDMFGMYEQFIKKKEEVYFNDKLCSISSTAQRPIILKFFRKIQTEFATKVILGGDYEDLKDQLKDSIGFGIIQENQDRYSFIHRTFAEFLIAKYILDYPNSVSKRVDIDQLMEVTYQGNCEVVRKFMDSKLDYREMASELKKPEYEEAIKKIEHQQFRRAMRTSVDEELFEVFCFQFEFYWYWYPKEMKEILFRKDESSDKAGLLDVFCRYNKSPPIPFMAQALLKSDRNATVLLFQMVQFLIETIFLVHRGCDHKMTAKIVIDLQDELEEKQILSEECLTSILFEISFVDYDFIQRSKETIDYLKHLKMKHEQLFYSFLREKNRIVHRMVTRHGSDKFYELFDETSDPFGLFNTLVVSVFTDLKSYSQINLKSYLNCISKYIRYFDPQNLKKFKTYLLKYVQDYGWYYSVVPKSQARSLFEFLRDHPHILSLAEFLQKIKIHKSFSFVENCALWGWNEDLEFILDAGDIEVEIIARLQLKRYESLDDKIKCILKSIRVHNTDEQLLEIARVKYQYESKWSKVSATILSKAILRYDELRKEIYSSWIKSDKIFAAFLTGTLVIQGSIMFVVDKFPQYKMKFFEINTNSFIGDSQHRLLPFYAISRYENMYLNKEEFLKLNQLQNDDGETYLFNICNRWNRKERLLHSYIVHPLRDWLQVMKKICTTDDITRLFRMKDGKGRTVFQILNNKSIYSCDQQKKCQSLIYLFFKEMNLVELMKELDISEKEVQPHDVNDSVY